MTRRMWPLAGLVLAGVLTLAATAPGNGGDEALSSGPVDRVLILSLPGVGWDDVDRSELPHLDAFVEGAAIGDLPTGNLGVSRPDATATDAYLTIGAGTRALAPPVDTALALAAGEIYGGLSAAEIIERRIGHVPEGLVYLGAAEDLNEESRFGAEVGMLGDHLAARGVERAVIANADAGEGLGSDEPPPDGFVSRSAVAALMGSDRVVPAGAVGQSLLDDAPDAAFGRQLDNAAVLEAFDEVWRPDQRAVVLVEASDLSRANTYAAASPERQAALRDAELAQADTLLGELLARVDEERDGVIVLSPVSPAGATELGMVAVRAPDTPAGLLQSASTRRDGYVQLADVAPTVLTLLGETPPDDIEGRSFQVSERTRDGRVDRLVDAADAADLRQGLLGPAITVVVLSLVGLAAIALWGRFVQPRAARAVPVLAFGVLGLVPGSFLAARVPLLRSHALGYTAAVAAVAAAVAAAALLAERRRPGVGPIVGVGAIVGLIGVDILVGAPLQINTVFGYSVVVAGRFTGPSNMAFALFGSAAIVLAALLVERTGRRGLPAVGLLLGAVILVNGLPMLGANVGGTVAMVPAFGVTALLLSGRRARLRELATLAAVAAVVVLGFALLDLARPASGQTHLARLAEDVLAGRWGDFGDTFARRWQASFGGAELAGWMTVLFVVLAAGAYAVLGALGRVGPSAGPRPERRPLVAAGAGVAVLATVGLVANDSSFAVPALMLWVIVPAAALRLIEGGQQRMAEAGQEGLPRVSGGREPPAGKVMVR